MHLTPGVVHNFPKAVHGCKGFLPQMHKNVPRFLFGEKKKGATPGMLVSRLSTIDGSTLPQDRVEE